MVLAVIYLIWFSKVVSKGVYTSVKNKMDQNRNKMDASESNIFWECSTQPWIARVKKCLSSPLIFPPLCINNLIILSFRITFTYKLHEKRPQNGTHHSKAVLTKALIVHFRFTAHLSELIILVCEHLQNPFLFCILFHSALVRRRPKSRDMKQSICQSSF